MDLGGMTRLGSHSRGGITIGMSTLWRVAVELEGVGEELKTATADLVKASAERNKRATSRPEEAASARPAA